MSVLPLKSAITPFLKFVSESRRLESQIWKHGELLCVRLGSLAELGLPPSGPETVSFVPGKITEPTYQQDLVSPEHDHQLCVNLLGLNQIMDFEYPKEKGSPVPS